METHRRFPCSNTRLEGFPGDGGVFRASQARHRGSDRRRGNCRRAVRLFFASKHETK